MAIELAATTDKAIVASASVLWPLPADRGIDERREERPLFLDVKPGMTVVMTQEESWWMGYVLYK